MSDAPAAKTCSFCGEDCAGQPRGKDPQGRYYHTRCLEEAKAKRDSQLTPRDVYSALDGGIGQTDGGFGMIGELLDDGAVSAPPIQTSVTCPTCKAAMAPGAVICTGCGYNATTGMQLASKAVGRKKGWSGAGTGAAGFLLSAWGIFAILVLLFLAMFGFAKMSAGGVTIYMLSLVLLGLVVGFTTAIVAGRDHGLLEGLLAFFCGIYTLIYALFRTERPWVRAMMGAYLVACALMLGLLPEYREVMDAQDGGNPYYRMNE